MENDERYIQIALEQAELAYERGEVPVGAIIIQGDEILSKACNCIIEMKDPTAHAEIVAIRRAGWKIGNYRLVGATLFTTLEPCIMCAGAILHSRIERVVFGADDPKAGALVSLYKLLSDKRLNHNVEIKGGVMKEACAKILHRFFFEKRITSPTASPQ
jgi:tRNA(adenine34) deaminase